MGPIWLPLNPVESVKIYPGFDHGMCATHKDQLNADLLTFLKG